MALDGGTLIAGPGASLPGLREARRRAGGPVQLSRLDITGFEAALARLYQGGAAGEAQDDLLFDLEDSARPVRERDLLEDAEDAPVIQLVNQLLRRAVLAGASDLHVEPYEGGLRARMRIDGFLQHPLFVPDDDIGRLELDQLLQPVVAIDHPAVQVVQVRGREPAAVERHEGT